MNKGISSSGRSFSSNKREPGADVLHFRLPTSAVPHRARATNCGNNKPSRRMAKCVGSTLMNVSLSGLSGWRFTLLDPPASLSLGRNKTLPDHACRKFGKHIRYIYPETRRTKYNLLFTFHFFHAEYFPQSRNPRSRQEDDDDDDDEIRALPRRLVEETWSSQAHF